jgi:hypothetical protein
MKFLEFNLINNKFILHTHTHTKDILQSKYTP